MSSPFSRLKTLPFQASVFATQATLSETSSFVGSDENLPVGVAVRNLAGRAAPEELVELVARQVEEVVLRERHGHPFLMRRQGRTYTVPFGAANFRAMPGR